MSLAAFLAAFKPTVSQLALAWFAASAVTLVAIALGFVWAFLDYGIDLIVGWWQRRQRSNVVAFPAERRKLDIAGRRIH